MSLLSMDLFCTYPVNKMTYLEDSFPSMTDIIADSLYYYVELFIHTAYIRFHIICYCVDCRIVGRIFQFILLGQGKEKVLPTSHTA